MTEVLSPDTPLFYDNYKEPLTKVENGFGYMGTLATNETGSHVQCHVCGYFYEALGVHLRTHNLKAREYKQKFGLGVSTALVGERVREAYIKSRQEWRGMLRPGLVKYWVDVRAGLIKRPVRKGEKRSLEQYNKQGVCPEQTLQAIKDLATKFGRTPSHDEFRAVHNGRFHGPILTHFGSWSNAVRLAGMITVGDAKTAATTKPMLIAYLKDFYDRHGRTPMNSDFKRGIIVPRYNYYKEFGTLNVARVAAGIPAVIPMPNRRYVEVPAEEYYKYEAYIDTEPNKRARFSGKLFKDFNWPIKEVK